MRVPARFMRISAAQGGQASGDGWLEVDIRSLDLDGVTKLAINLSDVANLRQRREQATSALDAWEATFGKRDDSGPAQPDD